MTTLAETFVPKAPPLREDKSGIVFVANSRVPLDTIILEYQDGYTAEQIAKAYDTVCLADVHAVLSYYFNNRDKVDAYLAERARDKEELQKQVESQPGYAEFREKMRKRFDEYRARHE
jgi:uncharacterized protein (DUF433 family)